MTGAFVVLFPLFVLIVALIAERPHSFRFMKAAWQELNEEPSHAFDSLASRYIERIKQGETPYN
jgi:hypothetical protein